MDSTSQTNQLILPSSSSSLPRKPYDVFLSFRGEDTRKSFTDHLFAALCRAGVRTFRDEEELRKGQDISTDLIKAIQESKISIIVFSKTYASSRWCLEELVKIVECKEKVNHQVVLPIFYDVDPSEVRKQTGGFGEALAQHQQQFGTKKVSQWKTTLTKVANFSGWDLRNIANGYESPFIHKIVEKVLHVVNPTFFNVAKYPVGIHTRVTEILSLLQSKSNGDVCMIGIYGMGGVGKTTLAKAIFNQISGTFEGSCFLDVRSECSKEGSVGLKCLQKQLLCNTLKPMRFEVNHVDEGISLIKARLGFKKVLIVVDDVDLESQLEALVGDRNWFGSGSAIIVTTRNVNLLNGLGKDCEKYNVAMLSDEESLQLFSWHAFKNPNPLKPFIELSNMIVSYADGLPLALTVLGSHFRTRSPVHEWSNDFEKLKMIPHGPHTNILETLKISYDALDDDTQRIFLDIACFFTCQYFSKGDIVKILNGCGFHAQSGIRTLIDRCLLEESLRIHDLVRDMGREIVRKESPMQPEKRSRLFLCDEVSDVLTNNKGTDSIETMTIDLSNEVPLSTKVFSKMSNLRELTIFSMNVKGSLKYLSNELRFLYWRRCALSHISSDICLEKLVILEMNWSNIKEFQPKLQHFRCLQILRLQNCHKLKRAPNFVGAHSLKELSLYGCSKLVKLPQSIGDLKNLISLNLGECENLNALPSSICNLKSLRDLYLVNCSKIKELPQSIGDIENLVELNLSNCKDLNGLPSSICNLKSLKYLYLRNCSKIKELPIDFAKLKWLKYLDASKTSVTHVPTSCGSLRQFKYLILGPQLSFGTYYDEECIGHSNTNLCSLATLQTPYEYVQHLDLQIGDGGLSLLRKLDLSYSDFDTLPFNLSHLSKLESLVFNNCPNLLVIEDDLPLSLYCFSVENYPLLKSIADLSGLLGLESLDLGKCSNLIEVVGVENLVNLRSMNLRNCSNLIELQGIENLVRLTYMDITGCSTLSSKYWCENLLKGLFKSPNIRGQGGFVTIHVSKEMVPQYLRRRSKEVVGVGVGECSYANYTTHHLQLFLKNKRIFIIAMVSWSLWESSPNKELLCLVYEQPNEVEEVMVLIEFNLFTLKEVEDNLSIETYIVYEDDGELYFFPINSKVVYKFNPKRIYKFVNLTLTTVSTTPTFYIVG